MRWDWCAAFFFAAVLGLLVACLFAFIREPARGASERIVAPREQVRRPFRELLRIRPIWWLVVAGIGSQIASYAVATFSVPLFQRYFGTSLAIGGMLTGVTIGVTGLVGQVAGGWLADRASRRSPAARVRTGAFALLLAAPLDLGAFLVDAESVGLFVLIFSVGWVSQYLYFTAAYPAFLAASYLLGGALGPLLAGALSDYYARSAVGMTIQQASAHGLHQSLMIVIPAGLLLATFGLFGAARNVIRDASSMQQPDSREAT